MASLFHSHGFEEIYDKKIPADSDLILWAKSLRKEKLHCPFEFLQLVYSAHLGL